MLSLEKSKNFIKDYQSFKLRIEKIPNQEAQEQLSLILERLRSEVRNFDKQHSDVGYNNRLSSNVLDIRSNIMVLRRQLDQKILEWEI